ncbi:MAG: alpha/beta hydrolase [Pirellulaceae bacterium]
MRLSVSLMLLVVASPLAAAEMREFRDVPYAGVKDPLRSLDVYAPAEGDDHPILIWIHGGGWRQGDKARMQRKPRALTDAGYVLVSVNYRLVPKVTVRQQAGDIAQAIAYMHKHAQEYGGAANKIVVLGHSAGAHQAALVCTDESLLKAHGVKLDVVKGCVPVDTAAYDLQQQLKNSGPRQKQLYQSAFGDKEEGLKQASPITFVAPEKNIPPFLILHVADRLDSGERSRQFAAALTKAGVSAEVVAAEGKTHGTINTELGAPGDKPTAAVLAFLRRVAGT